ncbi:amidohydrolase family protein [Engelhardtia mirabilis]|uniref:Amidohydrolase-related domain-containing protein n=1 Tax=Engelhardtia mirabilis TaxID=2528011 RepID=A0A518BDH9_9BACT|nr:hypothetical protein Pla133_01130 [Planctomycetes bacterium Pla133]QDU99376.1 hypothetical protein Pla86_01130 [Planctomycetes bacterium Pla86]
MRELRTCLPLVIGLLAAPTALAAPVTPPVHPLAVPTAVAGTSVDGTFEGDDTSEGERADGDAVESAPAVLIHAGRVIVRPGKELEGVDVLIEGGRIAAVGVGLEVPEGARVIEGAVVCAGFIDPWSTLGIDGASLSDRGAGPATRTVDGFDPYAEKAWREAALAAGVTVARIQAGAGSRIGGLGAMVRNDRNASLDSILLSDACVAAQVEGGDVFERLDSVEKIVQSIEKGDRYRRSQIDYESDLAEWEEAIAKAEKELEDDFKKAKKDRKKEMDEAREKGKEFKEKRYKEDSRPRAPRFDADSQVLARVASGELPIVIEAHRVAEMRLLLELMAKQPRTRWILAGASDGHLIAEELDDAGVTVLVVPERRGLGGRFGAKELQLAGQLQSAGVDVMIGTAGDSEVRDLPLLAAMAVGHGLDREAALAAITTRPARAFDLADRAGTVEVGKNADLVVLTGDPLASSSRVQFVVLGGEVVVERE